MKKIVFLFLVFFSCFGFANSLPYWIKALPSGIDTVYGLGSATIQYDLAQASAQAAERAKIELLMSLQTSVKGELDMQSRSEMSFRGSQQATSFDQQNTVNQSSQFRVAIDDLPGLAIKETYLDENKQVAYALAELDIRQARSVISNEQKNLQQNLQSLSTSNALGLHSLQDLQKSQQQLNKLLQLSTMLSAYLDAETWQINRQLQQQFSQQSEKIRQQLNFAWHPSSKASMQRHKPALQHIVSNLGLIWSDQTASFYVLINAEDEVIYNEQYKTTAIHSFVDISLLDAKGNSLKSEQFSAKGVSAGRYIAPAQRQLDQQVQQLTKQTFENWFNGF